MMPASSRDEFFGLLLMFAILAGVALVVCTQPDPHQPPAGQVCPDGQCPLVPSRLAIPPADFPAEIRTKNYGRGGSCMHASMITLLRWHGLDDWADWWRSRYAHGESGRGLIHKAEAAGLRIAYEANGDTAFLEWCSRTRRGAVMPYMSKHALNFVRFEGDRAVLLNNNHVGEYLYVPREKFVKEWQRRGGFALTLVYPTATPPPRRMAPHV